MSGQYIVSLRAPFASNWSKSQHDSLASALSNAWRKHKKDCSVDNISYEQKVIINHDALEQAFNEMSNLSREPPKRPPVELAEQIIQMIDKARTEADVPAQS